MKFNNLDIYIQAAQLISKFYYSLDNHDYDGLLGCICDKTVWHRKGNKLVGADNICNALKERDKNRVTSHQVNNLVVSVIDAEKIKATYYLSVFDNLGTNGSSLILKVIFRMTDILISDGDGSWNLYEKSSAVHIR